MRTRSFYSRLICVLLTVVLLCSFMVPVTFAETVADRDTTQSGISESASLAGSVSFDTESIVSDCSSYMVGADGLVYANGKILVTECRNEEACGIAIVNAAETSASSIAVYFVDTYDWVAANNDYDSLFVHAWNSDGTSTTWPGMAMEIVGRTTDDHGIWKYVLNPEHFTMCLFDAGADSAPQTVDLPYVTDAGSASYVVYTAGAPSADGKYTAAPGAVLQQICGHTAYTVVNNGNGTESRICDCCGKVLETVPVEEHIPGSPVEENRIQPSCTVDGGYDEVVYCTICHAELDRVHHVVKALGHIPGEAVTENIVEPTDTKDGSYDEVVYCTVCHAELSRVTIKIPANPDNPPEFRFDDVKDPKAFYFTPVYWAYYHDPRITNGVTAKLFGPEQKCTRGQVVTFLWRAAGCPKPKLTTCPFTDVNEKAFYYKAMLWAVEKGITTGTTKTTFSPNSTCTRGQVVTFLWRFKGKPKPTSSNHPFTDVNPTAYYYKAMLWAVQNKITNGLTRTKFGPEAACTRGQVVTFLYRAMVKK